MRHTFRDKYECQLQILLEWHLCCTDCAQQGLSCVAFANRKRRSQSCSPENKPKLNAFKAAYTLGMQFLLSSGFPSVQPRSVV